MQIGNNYHCHSHYLKPSGSLGALGFVKIVIYVSVRISM